MPRRSPARRPLRGLEQGCSGSNPVYSALRPASVGTHQPALCCAQQRRPSSRPDLAHPADGSGSAAPHSGQRPLPEQARHWGAQRTKPLVGHCRRQQREPGTERGRPPGCTRPCRNHERQGVCDQCGRRACTTGGPHRGGVGAYRHDTCGDACRQRLGRLQLECAPRMACRLPGRAHNQPRGASSI